MTNPIRIGFIGLSAKSWAALAHLPYLRSTSKYKIVALANSSVESAKAAIKAFGLPDDTKAYGSTEDIAKDPDVDLIVDSVRVDRHFPTSLAALRAGKNILVEWPLGKNLEEAQEFLRLKNETKIGSAHTVLQGRFSPIVQKAKSLIAEGRIGKVLSSTFLGQSSNGGGREPESVSYFLDINVGGNILTIHFGHVFDLIQQALGELQLSSSVLANRRPTSDLIKPDGSIVKDVPKTSHDQIHVISKTGDGAPVTFVLRGGKPFKGTPATDWRIYGETGEIRITASGVNLNVGFTDEKLELHDFKTDEVGVIEVPKDEFSGLPQYAQNVARLYDALARGDTEKLATFESAVKRHILIDDLYKTNP